MNMATARMLEELPEHLRAKGWRFLKTASRMSYSSPPACVAVYARRYERGVDDERWAAPTQYGFVRVTTDAAAMPSWEAARADAIAQMGEIDGCRIHQEPAGQR